MFISSGQWHERRSNRQNKSEISQQYEMKCTDKMLMVRFGLEPGTQVRKRRSNRLSYELAIVINLKPERCHVKPFATYYIKLYTI